MADKRVVVTGIGVVVNNGMSLAEFKENCFHAVSGLKKCDIFDSSKLRTEYAGVLAADLPYVTSGPDEKGRMESIVDKSLDELLQNSNLTVDDVKNLGDRACLSFATSLGTAENAMGYMRDKNREKTEHGWLRKIPALLPHIKNYTGIRGSSYTTTTACAASTTAVGIGFDLIKNNMADLVIAGGADSLSEFSSYGFNSLKALSKSVCKPFDSERDGINIGEGGAFVVLEPLETALKRNAHIYAEILGYGINNDAYHITSPDPEGTGALLSMKMAIESGEKKAQDIDYINAHGTGTALNDQMEVTAIGNLYENLGDWANNKLVVSSIKSMIGHCLAAAGILELAITIMMIDEQIAVGNSNLNNTMECNQQIELIKENKKMNIKYALSNSFAFAGNTASVLIGKYE